MGEVVILLSAYNGEKYIKEQIDSILNQTYKNFILLIRDDGSTDRTKKILKKYESHKNVRLIFSDENMGVKKSFSYLLNYALKNYNADYFMFSDQDDVWKKQKIEISLINMNNETPLLLHTDLEVVNENLKTVNKSFFKFQRLNPELNGFNRLLVQNVITGNTVMINRKLAYIIKEIPDEAIMHDWWIGLAASAFGKIVFLNRSTVLYRQHHNNQIGAKGFFFNILKKQDTEKYFIQAEKFKICYYKILDNEKRKLLEKFLSLKNKDFFTKIYLMYKYKFLKQGVLKNMGLFFKI